MRAEDGRPWAPLQGAPGHSGGSAGLGLTSVASTLLQAPSLPKDTYLWRADPDPGPFLSATYRKFTVDFLCPIYTGVALKVGGATGQHHVILTV